MTIKNSRAFRQRPEEFLLSAMERAGVDAFWRFSALDRIRCVLSGNRHFVADIDAASVKAESKYCAHLTCTGTVCIPDANKGQGRRQPCKIAFSFNPARKGRQFQVTIK
jgi:hypothetical protein